MRVDYLLLLAWLAGCSTGDPSARRALQAPSRAQFDAVSPALVTRCGSLDCHGSPYRNLRLFGLFGLRIDPAHLPETKIRADSEAGHQEIQANYDAVIGLEPEAMTLVLATGGKNTDLLSLVRKARGSDDHKGGARMRPGDAADRCVLSWLAGAVDMSACNTVVGEDDPPAAASADGGS